MLSFTDAEFLPMNDAKLTERVTLNRRLEVNPDAPGAFGNAEGDWFAEGTVAAEFVQNIRGGGENVMQGRLQGRHVMLVRVRASMLTRSVTSAWKLTDTRTKIDYAIRDVTPSVDRQWIEMLVESGVAI